MQKSIVETFEVLALASKEEEVRIPVGGKAKREATWGWVNVKNRGEESNVKIGLNGHPNITLSPGEEKKFDYVGLRVEYVRYRGVTGDSELQIIAIRT